MPRAQARLYWGINPDDPGHEEIMVDWDPGAKGLAWILCTNVCSPEVRKLLEEEGADLSTLKIEVRLKEPSRPPSLT